MTTIHEIGIGADTAPFEKAVRQGIIEPVDDADKALTDLGRNRGADQLEGNLRSAQRASDNLKRSTDDLGETGASSFRKIGDKGSEVGSELRQNLGETFSSFKGDLADLPQIAQDTLGGLAGSGALGGIAGLASTAAGAAGLGLISAALSAADAKAQELQQRASDMAQAFIDAGTTTLDAMNVAAATSALITDNDKRKQVQDYANALGVDFATAARAYVGDQNAMAVVDKVAAEAKAKNIDIADAQRKSLDALTPAQQKSVETNTNAIAAARELGGVVSDATSKFNDQQSVLKGLITSAGTATEQVDKLGNTLYTLPDGTQIVVDAKTDEATTDINKFKGDVATVPKHVETTAKLFLDTSQFDAMVARIRKTSVPLYVNLVSKGARAIQ